MSSLDPPRALQLRFQSDWGGANLTRACGWIAAGLGTRAARGTRSTIRTGRGMADNLIAVEQGEVDAALVAAAGFARTARAGQGPFANQPLPGLRAIGCLPHRDALLVAIPAALGVRSFSELRERRPALRIALSPNDGESFMGLAADAVLRASGIALGEIEAWGGALVECERPEECLAKVASGAADALVQEAIMTRRWQELAEAVDLAFLSLDDAAAERLWDELSLPTITVEPDFLRGLDEPVRAADFSGWLLVVREDLRDDVAGLLARILVEDAGLFERQYTHLQPRFSPLDYPVSAERLVQVPIPLHPGAEAYYREIGAL